MTENRLKHSYAVAIKMKEIANNNHIQLSVSPEDAFVLGMLHDIGYEFAADEHATAGGMVLKEQNYKYWKEVFYHGIPQNEYDSAMLRLLNYVDMITGPDGVYVSIDERIKDIAVRYGDTSWQVEKATELAKMISSKPFRC